MIRAGSRLFGALLAVGLLAAAAPRDDRALLEAAKRGDVAAVRQALKEGADASYAQGDGITFLVVMPKLIEGNAVDVTMDKPRGLQHVVEIRISSLGRGLRHQAIKRTEFLTTNCADEHRWGVDLFAGGV